MVATERSRVAGRGRRVASVVVEGLLGGLRCALLLVEQALESAQLLLHILVDLQVARHNRLHLIHVAVNVLVLRVLALDVLDEFALLGYHVRDLLKVLEVV